LKSPSWLRIYQKASAHGNLALSVNFTGFSNWSEKASNHFRCHYPHIYWQSLMITASHYYLSSWPWD